MNVKLLDGYKDIGVPYSCLYFREPNRDETFRIKDSPLAFLDLDKYQQQILYDWCMTLGKRKTINTRHTSYGIKHLFEHADNSFYVYNGALKGAMLLAGFEVKDMNDLNWRFNVSSKNLK